MSVYVVGWVYFCVHPKKSKSSPFSHPHVSNPFQWNTNKDVLRIVLYSVILKGG